jgi:hypothetical protein
LTPCKPSYVLNLIHLLEVGGLYNKIGCWCNSNSMICSLADNVGILVTWSWQLSMSHLSLNLPHNLLFLSQTWYTLIVAIYLFYYLEVVIWSFFVEIVFIFWQTSLCWCMPWILHGGCLATEHWLLFGSMSGLQQIFKCSGQSNSFLPQPSRFSCWWASIKVHCIDAHFWILKGVILLLYWNYQVLRCTYNFSLLDC